MGRKRNKVEIVYDILRIIQKNGGEIKKTHLMYKANLSHNQMKLYLNELLKKQLIGNSPDNSNLIIIAPKGRDFCIKYARVKEFERTFGL